MIAIIVKEKRRVCKSKDHMLSTNKKRPGTYPLLYNPPPKERGHSQNPRREKIVFKEKKTSTEQKGKKKVILNHTKKQPPSKKNRQEAKLEALTAVQKKDKERGQIQ